MAKCLHVLGVWFDAPKDKKLSFILFFRYTCNNGYFLDGSDTTTCQDDDDGDNEGVWSNPPPVCVPVTCPPPHVAPANGDVECSNANNEGSICR